MSDKFQTAKDGFLRAISPKKDLKKLFMWLIGLSAVIFFAVCLKAGNAKNATIFFRSGADFFMDCFNQIRDCAQGPAVYSDRHVIYPPMANLIFLVLSRFTNSDYNDTEFVDRQTWMKYGSSFVLLMFVFAVCFILTFALIFKATKRGSVNSRLLFAGMATMSVPMLYMLERGNMLILSVLSLLVYAFSYNSESKITREIGLLALAFSFSLKLYPVVFGWFLLTDKRWKEAIRCVIYGIAMLVLPSFFFGGPVYVVKSLYQNITGWSSGSGNSWMKAMQLLRFNEANQNLVSNLIWVVVALGAVCFVISSLIRPTQRWKTWLLGVVTILCVPSITGLYVWAFMLIPLIMLINQEDAGVKNVTYLSLITIPFLFLPFSWISLNPLIQKFVPDVVLTSDVMLSTVWIYGMTAIVAIFVIVDTLVDLVKFVLQKKRAKAE